MHGSTQPNVSLVEGFRVIQTHGVQPLLECFERAEDKTELLSRPQLTTAYNMILRMCTQPEPMNFSSFMYQKHSQCLAQTLYKEKLIPALTRVQDGSGAAFLKEWVKS